MHLFTTDRPIERFIRKIGWPLFFVQHCIRIFYIIIFYTVIVGLLIIDQTDAEKHMFIQLIRCIFYLHLSFGLARKQVTVYMYCYFQNTYFSETDR